jgi:hypothetical protein
VFGLGNEPSAIALKLDLGQHSNLFGSEVGDLLAPQRS